MELGLANSNFCTEGLTKLFLTKYWKFAIVPKERGRLWRQNRL